MACTSTKLSKRFFAASSYHRETRSSSSQSFIARAASNRFDLLITFNAWSLARVRLNVQRLLNYGLAPDPSFLQPIIGLTLSSVTFVMDYVQFDFGGPGLTLMTLPDVNHLGQSWMSSDKEWRNCLCQRIGVEVVTAHSDESELVIGYADGSTFTVSLRDEEYCGPEAVHFFNGATWVVL